jgi:FKBP-type peptidyl-prolyl cis-trans isomerase FkpA
MRRFVAIIVICLLAATSFAAEPVDNRVQETITTKSGMQYTSLKEGAGASPGANDTVRVHYRGTLMNGREFDSSYKNGRPAELRLGNVIKCWAEGLQMMKVGGKARLACPSNLAYGDEGIKGVVPPFATLTFEVELISIR